MTAINKDAADRGLEQINGTRKRRGLLVGYYLIVEGDPVLY